MKTAVSLIIGFDLLGLISYLCFCFLMDADVALCEYPCFVKVHLTSLLKESEEVGITREWKKAAKVLLFFFFFSGVITNLTETSAEA